ncbi:MAG TPA: MarR family winged helix-turn-helix transcriptional regulator [Burkholderiales bacterium]|nr:MarR family winged helix-turn-helix transcriptional regulator [Burkholderiales bacterium]
MTMDAARKRCTCFLLRKLTRRVTQAYDRALAPAGLTITQYSMLAHLARGEGASISALADRMGMERTTLVRNLKPLVGAGWARYGERRAGKRAALELTAAGRSRLRSAAALWERAQDALEAQLGAKSVAALHALVDQSLDALHAARVA